MKQITFHAGFDPMKIRISGSLLCVAALLAQAPAQDIGMTAAVPKEDRLGQLVTIPAGKFMMGNNGHEGYEGLEEFPQHPVNLPAYQIGKHEVTRGQYRKFIEAGGYQDPQYWSAEGWKWKESDVITYAGMRGQVTHAMRPNAKEKRGEPEHWASEQEWIGHGLGHPRFTQTDSHPVVGVTYYEAEAYCKWAGGRLPTEAEWEKAARWDEKKQQANTWPWGDTWDPEKCNNPEDHNPAAGGHKVNQSAPVGSYPAGASPYGCMDMVGNAYEWVADQAKSYPGNPNPFDHAGYHFVKGGCWDDGPFSVRCAYRGWYLPPGSSGAGPGDSDYMGFRVALDSAAASFDISRDGKPTATIVVAKDATTAANFAAAELQEHIRAITGATLPMATDSVETAGPRILVGESAATRALDTGGGFKSQEYLIKYLPNTLVLMGRDMLPGESTATGMPERVAGKFGSALKFDGTKTVFDMPDCHFDDACGSMEAWVWLPAAAPEKAGTILRLDGRDPWTYHIVQRDAGSSVVSYAAYDGKEVHRVQSAELSEGWHHLLATHDAAAARMELYVDGARVGESPYVKTTCNGATLRIGGLKEGDRPEIGNPFVGLIDEVRISKVVRSAASAAHERDPDTTVLFHFDEAAGTPRESAGHRIAATPPGLFEERGSLDAVYTFLERCCDVRWYAPGEIGLVRPSSPTLVVRGEDIRRAPAMDYRWIEPTPLYLPGPPEQVSARELLLWKLRMRIGGRPTAVNHSFYGYYDRFLADHPDWFAQGYTGKPPQMCYTHPDFIRQVVQDARDYFDGKGARPGAAALGDVFGLVPMDNADYCKCARCQAEINDAERGNPQFTSGWASDYVHGFVNKVAVEVRKTHPDKWLGALAYWNYAHYPSKVRLEPNVRIQPCLHTRNWWSPAMEANDRKVLADWRRQDPDRPIYLWLYYCFPALNSKHENFNYFPGLFAHRVVKQMKLFHDAGVRGIFLEHSSEFGATYLMDQLEFYVTFKLADDPGLDGDRLIEEFFTRYYGAAAAPMKALYGAIEDTFSNPESYPEAIQKSQAHQHQTASLAWDALGTPERMERFAGLMAQARAAAATPDEKARVALFENGIWNPMVEGRKKHDKTLHL